MRAVFYLPGEDGVHKRFELLYVGIPPGLDGRLAGDGVQDLIARGIGVGCLAAVQLFAYLLDGGGSVGRGYPRRDGADGVVPLAEGLYLKAELREQFPVFLKDVAVLVREVERYTLKQRLRSYCARRSFSGGQSSSARARRACL